MKQEYLTKKEFIELIKEQLNEEDKKGIVILAIYYRGTDENVIYPFPMKGAEEVKVDEVLGYIWSIAFDPERTNIDKEVATIRVI